MKPTPHVAAANVSRRPIIARAAVRPCHLALLDPSLTTHSLLPRPSVACLCNPHPLFSLRPVLPAAFRHVVCSLSVWWPPIGRIPLASGLINVGNICNGNGKTASGGITSQPVSQSATVRNCHYRLSEFSQPTVGYCLSEMQIKM